MQVLDSLIEGMMLLPDERDRRDYAYGLLVATRDGALPEGLRSVPLAMLTSNMPAISNSRARAEAGRAGGSKAPSAAQANGQANAKQTGKQTPSKPASKRQANPQANAKQTGKQTPREEELEEEETQPTKDRCAVSPGARGAAVVELDPMPEAARSTPPPCAPPTPDEVRAYLAASTMPAIDAERFVDHFGAVGWLDPQGRPISDWRAKARQWSRDDAAKRAESGEVGRGVWDDYAGAFGA